MARNFNGDTANYLQNGAALVTAFPLTFACWFNANSLAATSCLMSISDVGSANNHFDLDVLTTGAVLAEYKAAGATVSQGTSTTISAGVWAHAAAVYVSRTSYTPYLNAGGAVTGTSDAGAAPSSLDVTSIGLLNRDTKLAPANALIAEAGLWNVALTAADVTALAKGFSPRLVRPDGLVDYWPLLGATSPEIGLKGNTMTITGTLATAAHTRVFYPRTRSYSIAAAAAGGTRPVKMAGRWGGFAGTSGGFAG